MDWILIYICAVYALVLLTCIAGAFNLAFNATLMQRLAMFLFAVWAVWRTKMVIQHGWSYPHEPILATAMGLYCIGTILKTIRWGKQ